RTGPSVPPLHERGYGILASAAIEEAFGADAGHAQLEKVCRSDPAAKQGRYSPPVCIGAKKRVVEGDPDMAHVSTPYVERSNLSIRTQNRRFTRLLTAFSTNSITTFTRWRSTSPSTISAQPQYA